LVSFDAIVTMRAAHVLHGKRRMADLLSQARLLLSSGGLFLYCDHEANSDEHPDLYWEPGDQPKALEQAGFMHIRPRS
jgi:hypothetical protein